MVAFVNSFLSYLLLAVVSMGLIALAVFLGKKLRDKKDEKDMLKETEENEHYV
ncbi:MAG TPA: vanadium nitrogenase [Lachnospiraceae bacterium]|nr:vanadium nitrogenase [Lachnospiraceae bacterium]